MDVTAKVSDLLTSDQLLGNTRLDENIKRTLIESASLITYSEGEVAARPGTLCTEFILVIKGTFRVRLTTSTGRDVTLYHVQPGEVCALMLSCVLGGEPYPAESIAESDIIALALPIVDFERALEESQVFRKLVHKKFAQRLANVIKRMEQLCSPMIDCQLARFLLQSSQDNAQVQITHQELASELGTAREVISRHLKQFESKGWIQLQRGKIDIKDTEKLAELCH